MSFEEKVKSFSSRIKSLKDTIQTEEATKTSLVMPFFQALGYDVFNPQEFTPEFVADVGIKKGEKVDYAIKIDDEPMILIECKSVNENLEKHDSQLFRYFGTSTAKFAILTNGIIYRFYTDIEETNKMDEAPFLEVNLENIKAHQITELQKFAKDTFNKDDIFDSAAELKYMGQIQQIIKEELTSPSEDITRLILSRGVYDGVKTQSVVEKYQPLVKKSFSMVISEMINDRLKNALNEEQKSDVSTIPSNEELNDNNIDPEDKIVTTEEELDSYYLIKSLLRNAIEPSRITYTDKVMYFTVNLDNKPSKWICRIYIKEKVKYIVIPTGKEHIRYDFIEINDLYQFAEKLESRLMELI